MSIRYGSLADYYNYLIIIITHAGTGDLSSISGSDSDSNDDNVTMSTNGSRIEGSPLLLFSTPDSTNHAIYRCLVL